ncbi:beta-glucosidase 47 [Prunus dulcis]|uniref:Beta-glucosidase 47 n=1 Tax=Prunus dulcis TaxID=3755 RepID=A0A4Y1RMW4_PRUDU|nr:beta-glucosidase 47 [Prunus dulcis]
MSSLVSTLAQE